jgi:hypothetical protein
MQDVLELVRSRLEQARRVVPRGDYGRGYKDGSIAELEEVEEFIEETDDGS